MSDRSGIFLLLDKFLAERRESESGGYASVTKEDLKQLREIVGMIIRTKWDKDYDGASSINFLLVDRTQYRAINYVPIPYDRYKDSREKTRRVFDELLHNLDVATHEMQQFIRVHKRNTNETTSNS